ncbi:Ophiophagus venom factor, partial [Varanus komodoensis]
MLIAPNTLRVDSEETIVVEAHEHTSPIDILVTIQNFPQKNIILSRAQARLDPEYNMMTSVKIKIPTSSVKKEGQSKQHVYVQATSPLFSLQKIVPLSFQSGYIFIQTDKPIYTPGSSVRYRIFTVGHTLDPQSKAVTTEVANPDGIVVERNLILVEASGIITQVYRVPELSLTGTWKITAKYVDDDIQERFTTELEIKEYVLPNFEVTLESSKKFFYVDDKELIIDISARFLFGEDVQGQAFVIFGVIIHKEKKSIIESLSRVPVRTYFTSLRSEILLIVPLVTEAPELGSVQSSQASQEEQLKGSSSLFSLSSKSTSWTGLRLIGWTRLRLIGLLASPLSSNPHPLEFHLSCFSKLIFLTMEHGLATVIHALVISRLDYCNTLYVGLPLKTVWILQLVQNRAARLLTGTGHYSHITLVLYQLHWLTFEVRT